MLLNATDACCAPASEPSVRTKLPFALPAADPYSRCPHARETVERMLKKISIMPYQQNTAHGPANQHDHIARETEKLREDLIKKFLLAEKRARAAAARSGITVEELRKLFPFTPLPDPSLKRRLY